MDNSTREGFFTSFRRKEKFEASKLVNIMILFLDEIKSCATRLCKSMVGVEGCRG